MGTRTLSPATTMWSKPSGSEADEGDGGADPESGEQAVDRLPFPAAEDVVDLRAEPVVLHREGVRVAACDVVGFEDQHAPAACREERRDGEARHPRADHEIIDVHRSDRARALLREESRRIREGLELEGVATGILEEHRGLLARLADEAHVGLDEEAEDPAARSLAASASQTSMARTSPKWRTGTASPSTAFVAALRRASSGARCATIWCPWRSKSIHSSLDRPSGQPSRPP